MEESEVVRVGGGPISTSALLFDLATRHVFTAAASAVCVHSIETGATIRRLEGHSGTVTAVRLNPDNHLQLYSGALDKTIRLWDYKDAVLLRTFEVNLPVRGIFFLEGSPGVLFWWSQRRFPKADGKKESGAAKKKFGRQGVLQRLNLVASAAVDPEDDDPASEDQAGPAVGEPIEAVFEGKAARNWVADPQGRYVVGYGDRDWVVVWPGTGKSKTFNSRRRITCLACHPVEQSIAVGNDQGRIALFNAVTSDKPVQATYHWHAHAVSSVIFNSDGTYMLSGGLEAVLVIWQLESGVKRFLPRLGSPIVGLNISLHDTHYATVHEDNSVQIIDALSLQVVGQICGLRNEAKSSGSPADCGLLVEPGTGHIVLNGSLGALQFFNLERDTVAKEQHVVDRIYISRTEDEDVFTMTVEKACFSQNGEWLSTVEFRDDGETEPDVRLKFWSVDVNKYALTTSADAAHKGRITSLSAHPTELLFVTTGADGRFKAWGLQESGGVNNKQTWQCLYIRSYLDLPCTSSAFSADGSLLAIGTGHYVTLWNPVTCDLIQAISTIRTEIVSGLSFCGKSDLVSFGDTHLTVWNLLNCSVRWRAKLSVDLFCTDRAQTRFAVAPRSYKAKKQLKQTILEFTSHSPVPISQHNLSAYNAATKIMYRGATDDTGSPTLLLFDHERTFKEIADGRESATEKGIKKILAPLMSSESESKARQNFESLFGTPSAPRRIEEERALDAHPGGKDPSQALFDVPTHVVPPMDTVAGSFMNLLLRKRKRTSVDEGGADVNGTDEVATAMSVDLVDETVSTSEKVNAKVAERLPDGVKGGSDLGFLVDYFRRGKTPEILKNRATEKMKKKSKKASKKNGSAEASNGSAEASNAVQANDEVHQPVAKRKKTKKSSKKKDSSGAKA